MEWIQTEYAAALNQQAGELSPDLAGSILVSARLDGSNLNGAILDGTDLTGAVLTGADLTNTSFKGAQMTAAWIDSNALRPDQLSNALDVERILWKWLRLLIAGRVQAIR